MKHNVDLKHVIRSIEDLASHTGDTDTARTLREASCQLLHAGVYNMTKLLPAYFSLRRQPYTLDNHFVFEPMYSTLIPQHVIWRTGRQLGKSSNQAGSGILMANSVPFFDTLYVTPQFELTRRFSNNYVKELLEQSPVKHLWADNKTSNNVLQRSFRNGSKMFFSFAFLDAERTRGISASRVSTDETQGLQEAFLPIFRECLSAHPWKLMQFTGTPLTMDNLMEKLWGYSSQGEWEIPCFNCKHPNIPAMTHDLDAMIGPDRDDISIHKPAVICAKCRFPIDPAKGYWMHRYPERFAEFAGYHVPQFLLPMHYASRDAWRLLLGKQAGAFNTSPAVFYNEVCGEGYDSGSKLVTISELRAAATLHTNTIEEARKTIHQYHTRILSVDWGGGGIEGISFTTYAILGMASDGTIDVIYGHRSLTPHDYSREAKICLQLLADFQCHQFVHDFNGAGAYREKYVIDAGFPIERVVPISYIRATAMMRYVLADKRNPRNRYHLDKPRSLELTCGQIRARKIKFFAYDDSVPGRVSLIEDFLALVQEKTDSRFGSDIYSIIRQEGRTDDFAHAVNMGCCTLWHMHQNWPDVAISDTYIISEELQELIAPADPNWEDVIS